MPPTPPSYRVGFTGTRNGLTPAQKQSLEAVIVEMDAYEPGELHHGGCRGADVEAHQMVLAYKGWTVVVHPADFVRPPVAALVNGPYVTILPPAPPLKRNRRIVESCGTLIACPDGNAERVRSGTWMTIRHARRMHRDILIVYPSGLTERE
jgi:predicted Rossmann fold nucleotide-binding protein DprA/Smf involved in DNA uptake